MPGAPYVVAPGTAAPRATFAYRSPGSAVYPLPAGAAPGLCPLPYPPEIGLGSYFTRYGRCFPNRAYLPAPGWSRPRGGPLGAWANPWYPAWGGGGDRQRRAQ